MGNPFVELAKHEAKNLVRAGSVSLVKKASQAGYKIKPEVVILGIGDVISGTARRIPARVAKVLGQEPPNPSRLALISKRAASAIAGGLTLTGLSDLIWDFWHESSIAKEEREKLDQWLNSMGLRVGDPLSELTPEELTGLATFIADARGGKVSAAEIADFVEGLTHKGLARAAEGRTTKKRVYTSPANTVPGGGHPLGSSSPKARKYTYSARDVVEFLMNYYGIGPDGLANKIVAHKLLSTITVEDVEQYSRRPTPASGMALLNAMLAPQSEEDADDDPDGDISE